MVSLEVVDASVLVGIVHVLWQLAGHLDPRTPSKISHIFVKLVVDHLWLHLVVVLLGGEEGGVLVEPAVHVGLPVALVGQHVPAGVGKVSAEVRCEIVPT